MTELDWRFYVAAILTLLGLAVLVGLAVVLFAGWVIDGLEAWIWKVANRPA